MLRVIGVSSTPGNTALTKMFWSAKSSAADWTNPLKADLVMEYESLLGRIACCQIDETTQSRAPFAIFLEASNEDIVETTKPTFA
jgi:hypothetical protein